mmetsp:Transcript_31084/g.99758  ORF Transcript_31084/g.99758 Transcript_31084/m.99758 type:complete len:276 (-) Transcript_31084:577-1404(-)
MRCGRPGGTSTAGPLYRSPSSFMFLSLARRSSVTSTNVEVPSTSSTLRRTSASVADSIILSSPPTSILFPIMFAPEVEKRAVTHIFSDSCSCCSASGTAASSPSSLSLLTVRARVASSMEETVFSINSTCQLLSNSTIFPLSTSSSSSSCFSDRLDRSWIDPIPNFILSRGSTAAVSSPSPSNIFLRPSPSCSSFTFLDSRDRSVGTCGIFSISIAIISGTSVFNSDGLLLVCRPVSRNSAAMVSRTECSPAFLSLKSRSPFSPLSHSLALLVLL